MSGRTTGKQFKEKLEDEEEKSIQSLKPNKAKRMGASFKGMGQLLKSDARSFNKSFRNNFYNIYIFK